MCFAGRSRWSPTPHMARSIESSGRIAGGCEAIVLLAVGAMHVGQDGPGLQSYRAATLVAWAAQDRVMPRGSVTSRSVSLLLCAQPTGG